LAPAERLPVSFEKASMILPAILSTVPSALSRDRDFMACRPFHGQSAAWLMVNAVLPVCGGQYPASVNLGELRALP
jgi:hypothetical protein